jgi:hypothetical protein
VPTGGKPFDYSIELLDLRPLYRKVGCVLHLTRTAHPY